MRGLLSGSLWRNLYLGFSILYLLTSALQPNLLVFMKPLLMPLLFLYYVLGVTRRDRFLMRALIFSWLGDIFLLGLLNNGIDFLFGMISFMIAHVLFIISFRQAVWRDPYHATPGITLAIMVLVLGAALVVFSKIFPNSGELQMPVLVYMIVIVSMFYHAVRRRGRTTMKSYQMLFAGAFLFLFSDAALGWNKFYAPIPGQTFLIMATYLAAQYLIVEAMVAHPAKRPASEMAHA